MSYLNIMLRLSTLSKLRMSKLRKIGSGSVMRVPDKVLIVFGAKALSYSAENWKKFDQEQLDRSNEGA